ncbi:unnamed protein product [Rotaria socialis]|uniref:S-phase kinase-associated protein 1 n=1 Tax=Rotaria socialis TaxID=392032 RepID=A0A817TNN1_9BILA|nr:unnamed protein product [Rotaria socialis]CAF4267836.1 unnamed protein product [Rotaria socialis]
MAEDKIKVATSDGDILEVDLYIAKQWQPVKLIYEVLDSTNVPENPIDLDAISTETLKKIIEWSNHHKQDEADSADNSENDRNHGEISPWDKTFFNIKQEMIFEIIVAADHLGMTELLDMGCKTVANMIKGKTPEEVRQTFNIPNDLPPLQTAQPITSNENQ